MMVNMQSVGEIFVGTSDLGEVFITHRALLPAGVGRLAFCPSIARELAIALIQEAEEVQTLASSVTSALLRNTEPCKHCEGVARLMPRDRYRRDNGFRTLTDYFLSLLHSAEFTPTEVREAAMLAMQMFEDQKPIYASEIRRVPKGALDQWR